MGREVVDGAGATVENIAYLVDRENPTGYSQVLAEIDLESGQLVRQNAWGPEGLLCEMTYSRAGEAVPRAVVPFGDALGSVREERAFGLGDNALAATESLDYTAFGSPLGPDGAALSLADAAGSLTPYTFTGQRRDADTGLQYHRARWLQTGLGQWASQDPVFDWQGNLGAAFGYGLRQPLSCSDPSGLNLIESVAVVSLCTTIGGMAGAAVGSTIGAVFGSEPTSAFTTAWKGLLIGAIAGLSLGLFLVGGLAALGTRFPIIGRCTKDFVFGLIYGIAASDSSDPIGMLLDGFVEALSWVAAHAVANKARTFLLSKGRVRWTSMGSLLITLTIGWILAGMLYTRDWMLGRHRFSFRDFSRALAVGMGSAAVGRMLEEYNRSHSAAEIEGIVSRSFALLFPRIGLIKEAVDDAADAVSDWIIWVQELLQSIGGRMDDLLEELSQ